MTIDMTAAPPQLVDLKAYLDAEFGPGFTVVIPMGKHGLEGSRHIVRSLTRMVEAQTLRKARILSDCAGRGLPPDAEGAEGFIAPYIDSLLMPESGYISFARNQAVETFMANKFGESILWIDSDVAWEDAHVDGLRKLMVDHPEFDMIGAVVCTRTKERLPCIFSYDEEIRAFPRITNPPADTLLEIGGLGCGFTAVRRSLYEKVKPRIHGWYWQMAALSEDLFFCLEAKAQANARIAVHTGLRVRHIGVEPFEWLEPSEHMHCAIGGAQEMLVQEMSRVEQKLEPNTSVTLALHGREVKSVEVPDPRRLAVYEVAKQFAARIRKKVTGELSAQSKPS